MSKRNFSNDGTNSSRLDRSSGRISHRNNYSRTTIHERLAGGADAKSKTSVVNVNASKASVVPSTKVTPVASGISRVAAEAEEEIAAILSKSIDDKAESTGDKKVDDMIDYVIQNLQEAGKALASLGENFEHDLKLVFVDVMAKVQNWVGLAQLRVDAARTDINGLRKELVSRANEIATRDNEIAELRVKLAESEISKNAYEKALTENVQKGVLPIPSPSTMTFVPSRQPMPAGDASAHSAKSAADSQHLPGTAAASLYPMDAAGVSAHSGVSSIHPASAGMSSSQGVVSGEPSMDPSAVGVAGEASLRSAASAGASLHPGVPDGSVTDGPAVSASGLELRNRPQTAKGNRTPHYQLASHDEAAPVTADVAIQFGKGKDKGKRESELELELARLRKENEKIVNERAEYENAIQRALLRGVSSLNVETLRVLRCPPVACFTPCGPPPSPVNTVEALIPCPPKKTKDNWTPSICRTTAISSPKRPHDKVRPTATFPERNHDCCGKRPNTSIGGFSPRHKRSPSTGSSSMIFLLPQNDKPKVCGTTMTPQNRICVRPKFKKLDTSVCMRKA